MKQYNITGMSCAACSARVEKAVSAVDGVEKCSVSLLTNSMTVDGVADDFSVIKAVTDAGYGAEVKTVQTDANEDTLRDRETPVLKKRLFLSLGFLAVLMYFSMGHSMWGFPLPSFFEMNPVAVGVVQAVLAAAVMIINKRFFVSGFRGLVHKAPNMDTLISLGSSVSFLWSVYALIMMTDTFINQGIEEAKAWGSSFYFESAAMILVLITVGKLLEAKSKGKTTSALKALIELKPKTATVIIDGKETEVSASQLKIGDVFVVKPGKSIPADGVITDGFTAVNESALTGESIPVDKTEGDSVCAATVNVSGFIRCKVTSVGEDTALARIIRLVSEAASSKAPVARLADKVAGVFVPCVTCIAAITLVSWLIAGKGIEFALARAVCVLVISCPCALGLATPVAVMVGSGVGAKHGILFKTASCLEQTGKTQIIALDKTGTVTKGEPEVVKIVTAEGVSEQEFLTAAYSVERRSEHPLAQAVVREGEKRSVKGEEVTSFSALPGNGVSALINGKQIYGGSPEFIGRMISFSEEMKRETEQVSDMGCTPLMFMYDGRLLGMIAAADTVKNESKQAVSLLKKMGIQVVMLTGDNKRTAKAIGEKVGIENVIAGVLPGEKDAVIKRLKKIASTAMAGDGINDAPALTSADIGIAVGTGTDIAADAADVVLINSRLTDIHAAITLSAAVMRTIRENLFWAFIYNIICIPLAAGVFGLTLNPMAGAAAMSISSFCVVTNALRLNFFDIYSQKHGVKAVKKVDETEIKKLIEEINYETEKRKMTKVIKIEGMMCPHCEAHTKQALESLDGVQSAAASHKEGNAVVTLSGEVENSVLKQAVENAGYKVISID